MERLKEKIGELTYHPEPDMDYYARAHGEAIWLAVSDRGESCTAEIIDLH